MPPLWFIDEEFIDEEFIDEEFIDEELADGFAVPGCMAGEPVVVEPEPAAAGRSVDPDGAVGVCARAGAAAKAVAMRQAAICFFSIGFLLK